MSDHVNRQFRLAARPVGRAKPMDFDLHEAPVPTPGPNQALARTLYLSLDPTNRIWMSDMDQYMPPVEPGEVMRGSAVGQIVASNRSDYAVGDLVTGLLGWQDYCLISDGVLPLPFKLPPAPVSPSTFLGALGLTGVTAYFGLLDVGKPRQGETVVVSAAAGAVGSIAGQLAKLNGCRVVGIAGSDDKCAWITRELGFDAAINHRDPDWKAQLRAACPNGIDVDFENVGGEILDHVLTLMNNHGRVVVCGLISGYNAEAPVPGPTNFVQILMKRIRVQGFIIIDYIPRWMEAIQRLAGLLLEGRIQQRETVVHGLENAPAALNQLFDGVNVGKLVVKVADAPIDNSGSLA